MLYLIGPDGLVNWSFENFQKMVWMTMVHVLIPSIYKIVRFYHIESLKYQLSNFIIFGLTVVLNL